MSLKLSDLSTRLNYRQRALRVRRRGIGLEQTREKEGSRRHAMRSSDPAAAGSQQKEHSTGG